MGRLRGLEHAAIVALAAGAGFAAYDNLSPTSERVPTIVVNESHVVVPPSPSPVVRTITRTQPIVVEPAAPPASAGPTPPPVESANFAQPRDLGRCPPERQDPFSDDDRPETPEFAYDDSVSHWNPRLRAAWGDGRVMLSRDGGLSWFEASEPPGSHEDGAEDGVEDGMENEVPSGVRDVAFDCHGRAFIVGPGDSLGVVDLAGPEGSEQWTLVPGLRGHEMAMLVIDEHEVGILLDDPVLLGGLLIARRNERGRWTEQDFWSGSGYSSWDGVSVTALEHRKRGRFSAEVVPWQGGECGYEELYQVDFSLEGVLRSRLQ